MWVALDLETTGLNPKKDKILECAVAQIDFDEKGCLKEILRHRNWVVDYYVEDLEMNDYAREMHNKNGLLQEIAFGFHRSRPSGARDMFDLDLKLCSFVEVAPDKGVVLVGNSIHFDRSFLVENCPMFSARLSHRMVDVSSFNLLNGAVGTPRAKTEPTHRAMADVESSIYQLKPYIDLFRSMRNLKNDCAILPKAKETV